MPTTNEKFELPQIRNNIQQIIGKVMTDGNLHSMIPDDVPILDLGVSSLALVEGMRQVYDRFGVLVSIRRVIEGQITIGTLALYIEQELNSQQSLKKKSRSAGEWKVERQIPLAPSQQHLAFLSRYSSEAGAAFNEALVLRLKGALHGPAIHTAVEEVGNRYEALRTALNPELNALDVGTGETLELVVTPISAEQLQARLTEIVTRPFELGKRLFHAELLRLSENEHVLVLVGHALVLEQHALKIILDDIAKLYQVFSHDQPASPAPLTLQWTDYLALSDTDEAQEAERLAEEYWKNMYVAGGVPRLELPADNPRPPVKKYLGSRVDLRLDPVVHERLLAYASLEDLSPETILFSAFTIFVQRLSDLSDLVVGVESESLYLDDKTPAIANTRDMLPLRTTFDVTRDFKEHIRFEAEQLAKANLHRHLSLAELIQLLQLPRDQSRSALFTVAFRSQKADSVFNAEGLESSLILSPSAGARYDIELIVLTQGNTISLVCDYSTELFEAETILRWLNGMAALLDSGLQDSNQACGVLPIMPARERDLLLTEWNQATKSFPREKTVLDLISEQSQASREATAIRFGDQSLSYGQLIERVEQVASALHQRGVKHGDHVGVLLKRSLDLVPTLLAVWRVGALYIPIDIGFPKSRIAYMLTDSNIHTVITNKDLVNQLDAEHAAVSLNIEDVSNQVSSVEEILPARGDDSAYIIYTSGSTGKPKGVEVRHSALVNCLLALKEYQEFTPNSSMLAMTTISFDVSANELFTPLISGGCVELAEDGLVADGTQIVECIANRKPTHIQLTASIWKAVLAAGWQGDENICLASCGEAISRELAEQLLDKCRVLWNFYGPTETTVYSTAYHIESAPDQPMRIGRPLPNTQIYILDKHYQPVPIGAIGDLYIAGDGLAVGYWQRPELTAERFVTNSFRTDECMYGTGDLARYLPNGDIICLGRIDDQVKIHGVRVELGEVESALRSVEGVRDAVVVSWKDTRGDTQLVAHMISAKDLTTSELRTQLRERLPEVMIPPYILFTDAFPYTANGKIQRAALPSPDGVIKNIPEKIIELPATVTEQMLARAWANILSVDVNIIGRDSDFMDLGGHSLLMTLLMIEVRKMFHFSFNLREFFSASTLRKFATLIDERKQQELSKSNGGSSSASSRSPEWARQRMAFLQREAELPRYIAPARGVVYQPAKEIQNVLLTGGTGFLGAYIIAEILKTTQANVYCLVRPKRGENGKERIERQMKRYQVWVEDEAWQSMWNNRLHVVDGDVTLPRLGMKDADYESLARSIDAIFHGAAHVNFIYPYEALRATNVLGIHEVIQFAFHSRIKAVHHLSTAAIWPMGAQNTYYEKDPIDHVGVLNLGYDEAKWVGEKCLIHAEERGLPVTRYRPGEVGGDSVTGHCVADHFIIACFKGFLQFGIMPDLDIEVDVAPVDYVAKSMVYLAFHRNVLGRAFHLTNPSRRRMKDGMLFLRSLGYQFEELPFVELRDRLVNSRDFSSNALFAYQAALEDMDNVSMQLPIYDTRETKRELAGSGIECAPADEKLFGTYLRYLQGIGFIPQPENMLASL